MLPTHALISPIFPPNNPTEPHPTQPRILNRPSRKASMPRLTIISISMLAIAGSLSAAPITLEPLILNGDSPDGVVGTVTFARGTARINNQGQWVAAFIATDKASGAVANYAYSHAGVIADPYAPFDFGDGITIPDPNVGGGDINNHGEVVFSIRGNAFDANDDFLGFKGGLFTQSGPIVRSGDLSPLGSSFSSALDTYGYELNDHGHLLASFRLGITIFPGPDSLIQFVRNGDGSYTSILHAARLQSLSDDYTASANYSPNLGTFSLNNSGIVAAGVAAIGPAGVNEPWTLLDGQLTHTSGQVALFGGSEFTLVPMQVTLNNTGDIGYLGGLENNDWDTGRWAVFRNDFELVWLDDGQTEHLEGRNFSIFRRFEMTDAGDLYWLANFDDSLGLSHIGLFHNGELLVSTDQSIDEVLYFPTFTYDISDNGEWLIIESQENGIFRSRIPTPGSATLLLLTGTFTLLRKR